MSKKCKSLKLATEFCKDMVHIHFRRAHTVTLTDTVCTVTVTVSVQCQCRFNVLMFFLKPLSYYDIMLFSSLKYKQMRWKNLTQPSIVFVSLRM